MKNNRFIFFPTIALLVTFSVFAMDNLQKPKPNQQNQLIIIPEGNLFRAFDNESCTTLKEIVDASKFTGQMDLTKFGKLAYSPFLKRIENMKEAEKEREIKERRKILQTLKKLEPKLEDQELNAARNLIIGGCVLLETAHPGTFTFLKIFKHEAIKQGISKGEKKVLNRFKKKYGNEKLNLARKNIILKNRIKIEQERPGTYKTLKKFKESARIGAFVDLIKPYNQNHKKISSIEDVYDIFQQKIFEECNKIITNPESIKDQKLRSSIESFIEEKIFPALENDTFNEQGIAIKAKALKNKFINEGKNSIPKEKLFSLKNASIFFGGVSTVVTIWGLRTFYSNKFQ